MDLRRTGELSGGDTSAGLIQLQRAQAIRDVFFRAGGRTPGLRLEFRPVEMDASITQLILDVDGQLVRYAHGPQVPTQVQWPGTRGSTQVRVQVTPPSAAGPSGLVYEGPWALFRMMDRTSVEATSQPEKFRVTFNLDGRRAVFRDPDFQRPEPVQSPRTRAVPGPHGSERRRGARPRLVRQAAVAGRLRLAAAAAHAHRAVGQLAAAPRSARAAPSWAIAGSSASCTARSGASR